MNYVDQLLRDSATQREVFQLRKSLWGSELLSHKINEEREQKLSDSQMLYESRIVESLPLNGRLEETCPC